MTATNHALTGALIALVVKQPSLAIPLAFISHFILDAIPHFGIEEDSIFARNKSALFWQVVSTDAVLFVASVVALPVLVFFSNSGIHPWVIIASMFAAYIPDSVWAFRFARENLTGAWEPGGRFVRFHRSVQWSETEQGLHVEWIWAAIITVLIGILI
jgi:hypothetical protein